MKAHVLVALTIVNLGTLFGQVSTPSNGSAMPPAYATPTPPVNGRTWPLPASPPGNVSVASDGTWVSPDGTFLIRGPLPPQGDTTTPGGWRKMLVERLIALPSPVKAGAVQLYGMGDEAAVDILRLLGARGPLTVAEERSALDVVDMAFEHPNSIIDPNYRSPGATVFLLRFISGSTGDQSVKDRATTLLDRLRNLRSTAGPSAAQ